MSPAISLILAVYNREKFIAAAIKSILNQTRRDFELVVWDDGSTDESLQVAKDTAKNDPRVRVVAGEHHGVTKSLNGAAKLVSAPYFAWIDSDDMLAESALKETSAILDARSDVGVVYSDYLTIDEAAT